MAWISSGRQDIYLDIADKYEQYIKSGLYQNGDKLPSVRTAASDMGVNPNTVARAYALLEESGPDHDKRFVVQVSLNSTVVGIGEGKSKKRAEQAAAHEAIGKLFPEEL